MKTKRRFEAGTARAVDRAAALKLAHRWEEEARRRQAAQGAIPRKPTIRVRPGSPEAASGFLSQREVALVLGISVRAVREIERRAFEKLRQHPALQELWREWKTGVTETSGSAGASELTSEEIKSLFGLARTTEELRVLQKLIAITRDGAGPAD